jgi:DHA2 family multidrug resistance protein
MPGVNPQSPSVAAGAAREIARQAQMLAFVDLFWFIGIVTFAILPLLLLMKKPTREGVFIPAHA